MVFPIVGGDGKPTGYEIDNSLRLNDGDSGYLTRAQSNGNQDKWTWSGWVKRSNTTSNQCLFATTDGSATSFDAKFNSDDDLEVYNYLGGGYGARLITNRKFRDVAAWYHIVIIYDSGNSTEAHRLRIYVNGTEESSFSTTNYPSQNEDSDLNVSGSNFEIGRQSNGSQFFDGYMAEVHLLDGQAYDPTYFGETNDEGIWIPKQYTGGNYGTNGFYLQFKTGNGILGDATGRHIITPKNGAIFNESVKKFGSSSLFLDNTNNYLDVTNNLADFGFGAANSNSWTVEFWAYKLTNSSSGSDFIVYGDNNSFFVNYRPGDPQFKVHVGDTEYAFGANSPSLANTTWAHIAVVNEGGTLKIYKDGTVDGTTHDISGKTVATPNNLYIGYTDADTFDGYIDELRISDVARYTGNFSVETSRFTSDTNTKLLLHMDNDKSLGADTSGNDNSLNTTNIDLLDQTTDTPTNSFCTINSIYADDGNNLVQADFSEGGTKMLSTVDGWKFGRGTFLLEAGKWYVEVKGTEQGAGENGRFGLQPSQGGEALGNTDDNDTFEGFNIGFAGSDTVLQKLDTGSGSTIFSNFTSPSIAMLAIDLDNNKMWVGSNGTWYNNNNASTTLSASNHDIALPTVDLGWVFGLGMTRNGSNNIEFGYNWGQPSFAIASGNSDANGHGNFEFPVPSGFFACCTKNLAEQG